MPPVEKTMISDAELIPRAASSYGTGRYTPWVLVKLPIAKDDEIVLCDLATAGFPGTSYLTWLEANN